ncbi:hypothetical protein COW36_09965 [bacterium (Candidatus Blackallbacteria) CG17_big_fil_post_rev_8_21_14_2_50_48_46]|uniref:protein O-GlcNAc transferase n=1 Tax=bacterium (Candidatus Blackallbacteria) CG17_big_fil_post_rev_8_21_14_2_50_48_46 TaxID=2014261 RepID=A0A2M7G5F6_9BACT|nr:MAG: hypothetical protein COW64_13930 [bacterium (Candidatus Blackallbacteria) CG18_big_fil_WC_8_21_14_2_50_49_26]PIW17124.1 MAG: hypothetical protein COW36_09965 [bacterium (Candidatus Blackallbacteria) CG17_big_fil_post_rev_8_21_14_2_50_48_46]PIW47819.1 MAG: hypothetical protein COW20_11195 [bacterium (Candidatus Blackallbacteria) CG13_big_fil_rev_8_21_14_2_50_49_14]
MSYHAELRILEPFLRQAEWSQAQVALAQLLKKYPEAAELHYRMAVLLQENQVDAQADAHYLQVLRLLPQHAPSWFGRGFLALRSDNLDLAETCLKRAVQAQPDFRQALDYLAQALWLKGQETDAFLYWEACLQIQSELRLHQKLCLHYQALKRWSEALAHVQEWLALCPNDANAWNEYGLILRSLKQAEPAHRAFERALELEPGFAQVYTNLGHLARECGQMTAALAAYCQAITLQPTYAEGWLNYSQCLYDNGLTAQAQTAIAQALQLQPALLRKRKEAISSKRSDRDSSMLSLRQALQLPRVYACQEELLEARARLSFTLAQLQITNFEIQDPLCEFSGLTNFYLAYQGQNDRELNSTLAQFLQRYLSPQLALCEPAPDKLKIGLVSACFQDHSVTHCFGGMIQALAQEPDFEVLLFLAPSSKPDQVTELLKERVQGLEHLSASLEHARLQIQQQALDLLIYPELGMDHFSWLLAFSRLAPHQAVLSGHPTTSGIPTIDTFISHADLELPSAQNHYSENLLCLPGVPVNYTRPPRRSLNASSDLGLPSGRHLYLCPMTLFKIHPDFDAVIKGILERDPQADLYLFKFHQTLLHQILERRFQRSLGNLAARVHFLPWMPWGQFMLWLENADVVLDTFHFGGGNTLYMAFEREVPVVTWPSEFQRGRGGLGLYQAMGLDFGVAQTPEDYIQIAVRLAQEKDWNRQCRLLLRERNALIFGQTRSTEALILWLKAYLYQK